MIKCVKVKMYYARTKQHLMQLGYNVGTDANGANDVGTVEVE
jgi:hypothetical protein